MRAGLSTIQQTLTPEAAGVLNLSISEAARRNHGQTTPLHVAATLLAAPSGFLRQACIKSHPNSSHPLQCRALELCFSVALERLPTAQGASLEPPISNALMAALKRAQAHQRRGCPEQQQQPLLAVKVELEQLIISILDDPSVSRVMREARFSSPAVKAAIEQSLNSTAPSPSPSPSPAPSGANPASAGLGFRPSAPTRNVYLNPRLQQLGSTAAAAPAVHQRGEDVKKVFEILSRSRKRNPVLVGESEPEAVVRELVKRIEGKELNDGPLKSVQFISLEIELGSEKLKTISRLGDLVEARMSNGGGIVLDFGDLKWLVEQPASSFGSAPGQPPPQQVVSEMAKVAVTQVAKLLDRFRDNDSGDGKRIWLIGTATCETYLRCQVYHPSMETDWDLQAVPIAARSPLPGFFPRLGTTGILGNSVEPHSPLKCLSTTISNPPARRLSENLDPSRRARCCPKCSQGYEQELAKLKAEESAADVKLEAASRPTLPQWLQNAKGKDEDLVVKQKIQDLEKKWNETCHRSHPHFHQPLLGAERINPTPFSMTGQYKPNLLLRQNLEPKTPLLQKNLNMEAQTQAMQLKPNPKIPSQPTLQVPSSPGSPVRTDLVLGRTKGTPEPVLEKPLQEAGLRDFLGCISSDSPKKVYEFNYEKLMSICDTDSFKKLLKGLTDSVWWQRDAASALATVMNRSKMGQGKRSVESRGDRWILFAGPDRVGKKKMGSALSELVCATAPITISFGSRRDNYLSFRGKTALDRIAEGVRRNPFSVVILEDVDEADVLVQGSIKRAMDRGRIADSHGREISLGNVTFIITANWVPDNVNFGSKPDASFDEEKLASFAEEGWRLKLSVSDRTAKRRASWLHDTNMTVKLRKERGSHTAAIGFDLNEAADHLDERTDGSHNSSDVTVENEYDQGLDNRLSSTSPVYREILCHIDDSVIFKPVDLASLQENISILISSKFSSVFGDRVFVEVQGEALERILGGVWVGRTRLEEWTESVLIPSLDQLKARLSSTGDKESMMVRLECVGSLDPRGCGDWLPRRVELAIEGL